MQLRHRDDDQRQPAAAKDLQRVRDLRSSMGSNEMNEGLQIGHSMAEVAADNAGETWKRLAYEAFVKHAKSHEFFMTEDVRSANPDLPTPPDMRAWGQVALLAKREEVVSGHLFTRAKSRSVHGMVVTMWRSNIFKKEASDD